MAYRPKRRSASSHGSPASWAAFVFVAVTVPILVFMLSKWQLNTYCPAGDKSDDCALIWRIFVVVATVGAVGFFILLWWWAITLAGLRGISTSSRNGSPASWAAVVFVALAVPLFAFLLFQWQLATYCPARGQSVGCDHIRLIVVVVAAVGAVGFCTLLWWWATTLAGLRGIFEIPWFGVGEDVESASLLESAVRAAIFVIAVWLIIGSIAAPFVMVMLPDILRRDGDAGKTAPPAGDGSIVGELKIVNANLLAMRGLLDKQQQQLAAVAHAQSNLAELPKLLVKQEQSLSALNKQEQHLLRLSQIDARLTEIRDALTKQDGRLASLDSIQQKLRDWDPSRGPSAATVASILDEARRANSGLDEMRRRLSEHGGQLALLGPIQQKLEKWDPDKGNPPDSTVMSILDQSLLTNTRLSDVLRRLSEHGKQLGVLDKILLALEARKGRTSTDECFDYVTSVGPQNLGNPASPGGSEGKARFRTMDTRQVFFDRGSPALSDWAKQDLSWFLGEANIPDGKLAIYGSTDPQGTKAENDKLARLRVEAIQNHILEDGRLRGGSIYDIISVKSAGSAGAPKSEPYKRVAYVRLLLPCP